MSQVTGIGVDIVNVAKFQQMLEDQPHSLETLFTPAEHTYCQHRRNSAELYAARFAAKEAVLKALGCGMSGSMSWVDIEIKKAHSGQPTVELSGEVARWAGLRQANRLSISLSHCREYAVAYVLAEQTEG
jgi:holo-[acyl-carrier protein] synthase